MKLDTIESLCGAALGLLAGTLANYYVLPVWGFTPTASASAQMALVFFAISFVLRFCVRRVFRGLECRLS